MNSILCLPREVCECLQRLGDEGEVSVGLLSGELVRELEEGGAEDGGAEVAQEDAGGDQVVAHLRLARVLKVLPGEGDREVGIRPPDL